MSKRKADRYIKRLEAVFTAGAETHWGTTSDLSEQGMFIRTLHALVPGTVLDIEIHLPDNVISKVRGKVRRAIRIQITGIRNGMGIDLIETDNNYIELVKKIQEERR
ncbi:MAG: PilZ domain-containing protein [Nitrospirae bacterium]|nr:PilZ domain-containing protein [Nitrospirota bacterium]